MVYFNKTTRGKFGLGDYKIKKMTMKEAREEIEFCRMHGYVSRILTERDIEDIRDRRTERFGNGKLGCSFYTEEGFVCENCVSVMAFEEKTQKAKLEFSGKEAYLAVASYSLIDDKPCVMESVKKFDGNLLVDFGGGNSVQGLSDYFEKTYTDILTGANNRRFYTEKIYGNPLYAGVAMIDLDDFKIYNDLFGHVAGDAVLIAAVKALKKHLKINDSLIRYGGDEFLLILRRTSKSKFMNEMRDIVEEMRITEISGLSSVKLSVSVGAVWGDGERAEELVKKADELMYVAKKKKDLLVTESEDDFFEKHREKPIVLIVDDSPLNIEILSETLKGEYEIIEASSGEECISQLKEYGKDIAVVLLDIIMPGMNGFDVLDYMKYNHILENVPVIAISGDENGETIRRAYEAGVSDYIGRPFDAKVVYRRVANTINVYEEQKRLIATVTREMLEKERDANMLIELFGELVEFRNGFGGKHVKNIGNITELLLEKLITKTDKYGIRSRDIFLISTASALHDVGKFAVPAEIVNKPGKLTAEEYEEIKKHTIYGAKIIESVEEYREEPLMHYAYEICRWHHERYDGGGYPDGLKGDEIPISAQVVSVCDVYDALVSERVYKKAVPHEKAIEMIKGGECGVFNPVLIECLDEISEELKGL